MLHILFLNEHSWLNNCEETFKSPSIHCCSWMNDHWSFQLEWPDCGHRELGTLCIPVIITAVQLARVSRGQNKGPDPQSGLAEWKKDKKDDFFFLYSECISWFRVQWYHYYRINLWSNIKCINSLIITCKHTIQN